MCENNNEWTSLRNFEDEEGHQSLVGGVAAIEPEDIEVRFNCPECGHEFISDSMEVPAPNMSADVDRESRRWNSEQFECSNPDCNQVFDIEINNGFGGMDIEVDGVERHNISFRTYPRPIDNDTD